MVNDYRITSRLMNGAIYLRYEEGILTAIAIELNEPLNDMVFRSFCSNLPMNEAWVKNLSGSFEVKPIQQGRNVRDKVIMFCSAYKHYRGVPYNATKLEKANVKNVMVTTDLLKTFFKSPLANYTMDNYIKRINVTRDWNKNGMNQHLLNAFPDDYDPSFEASLEGERLSAYWNHLRDKGWKKDERSIWRKQG